LRWWRTIATAFSAAWLLAACGPLLIRNEAARDYVPLRNASVELHRDVVIPPERARVFFQDGVVQAAVNEYTPHCELTVRNLVDRPQTIYADHFTVERVTSDVVHVVTTGGVVVAVSVDFQLASGGGGGDSGGDGEGRLMKIYTLYLHSDRQPNVLSLVCGGAFNMPALAVRPSVQDIETALGDYATLQLR
jgi:hypothetical protein